MNEAGVVMAVRIERGTLAAASWEDQERLAPPGAFQVMTVAYAAGELYPEATEQTEYDVNCPGCGSVCHLRAPEYPVSDKLTCAVPLRFAVCCGWEGTLDEGLWRPRRLAWWEKMLRG